ncbi:MAG: DoxX family membrane protein [Candidatus Omnitrophica bacterium]|nr:DoxX family membrane protein [Candidatus Omnitrophota bacterium]
MKGSDTLFNLSMFILRAVLGSILIVFGARKLFGMFGGMGLEITVKMVEGLGVGHPVVAATVWAVVEFTGGICILLGILSRWAATAIFILLFIYLLKVDLAYGFIIKNMGLEFTLLMLGACTPLILLGGGNWSVWDV